MIAEWAAAWGVSAAAVADLQARLSASKDCSICGERKPFEAFHRKGSKGRMSYCGPCRALHRDAERERVRRRERYREDPERDLSASRRWREANPEKMKAACKNWRENNPEVMRELQRRWDSANPAKRASYASKRNAAKKQRTPPWLSEPFLVAIEAFYLWANAVTNDTGIPHEVDHIVPLQGEFVSGLHVPWNLQVITASANASKGNRFDVNNQ